MFLKQAIILLSLTICVSVNSYSQVNLTQGLVAYYPFSGNANDASGNNINGVVNGAVLTTDAGGNANSAYLFDGTASYISLPFNSLYDFAPTDSFSISTWILPYQNPVYAIAEALVVKSPYHADYFQSNWNYGLYLVYNKLMTGWAANNIINGTTTLSNSQCWYHLAVTYKNGIWHLYVNGQQEAQDLTQTHFIIQDGANSIIAFGRKGEASGDYYKGKMDEVRIYNRNLNPAEVKALYDMYNAKPEFSFTQDICNPKQITFKNETGNVNSFSWDFGNGTTNNSSTNPVVNYASYNNYSVKLVVTNLSGCKDSVVKNILVTTQFVNGLVKNIDTTICNGASFKLNVQDSGLAYCWSASNGTVSNSSANITVAPIANTTYYYNTQVLGTNLIVNGDFESGNTGFTSDYTYQPPPNTTEGVYYIGSNPQAWNGGASTCNDHSSTGKMMMINGSPVPNINIWKETVTITPNTNYAFSCWLQSIYPVNPAQLKFSINGIQLGQLLQATSTPCDWKQLYIVWNSGNNTSANISIVNQNTQVQGNDFALDDISFAPVLIMTDSVKVIVNNCPIDPCKSWLKTPSANSYVDIGDLDISGNQITVECNFNADEPVSTPAGLGFLVDKHTMALDINYALWPEGCAITTSNNGYVEATENCPVIRDKTYHVAMVYDGSSLKYYRNGFLQKETPASGTLFQNNLTTCIARNPNGAPFMWTFNGNVNEVRIWNVARTQQQIQQYLNDTLPNPTTQIGLQAYYTFNSLKNKQGNVAFDGVLKGAATINETNPNCNLVLDNCPVDPCKSWLKAPSTSSYVECGNINISGDKLTVEAKFNSTSSTNTANFHGGKIVSKHTNPADCNYSLMDYTCEITTQNTGYVNTPATCLPSLDKQYHVAMVYDGSLLKFYRDGILMSQIAASGNLVQNNLLTAITQGSGASAGALSQYFGNVNEVRIWNVARTQQQIQQYMNDTLPNPNTQIGLQAYYTFNSLKNKQGNTTFDGVLKGAATINETNPNCSFVIDSCGVIPSPIASFTTPDTVCVNTPITINNTSTGATTYNWNFCDAGYSANVSGVNLGNIGNNFSTPVSIDYVFENGNYYAFVVNFNPSGITRLDFGNSLLNTPVSIPLNSLNGLLWNNASGALAIKIVRQNNNWYAILTGGSITGGNPPPHIYKIDFGNSILNLNPILTDWGNLGGFDQPHQIHIWEEANNWYGLILNSESNTISRINFSNSFTNTPTVVNLGNIGNLNFPSHFDIIKDNGNYRVFVTNTFGNSISRIDFGTSLLNNPTGINLGNISNILSWPRGVKIYKTCNSLYGYIVNQQSDNTIKLDFNNSILNIPTATIIGNTGLQNNSSSLSNNFFVGNDKYFFRTNSASNTISLIKFAGCTNSSIPNSSSQTPPQISYNTSGTYNINLTIDEGLPTQSSFCKQVVVNNCAIPCAIKPDFTFTRNVCNSKEITFKNQTPNTSTFKWNFGNNTTNTTNQNPTVSYANNAGFWVQLIVTQTNGCKDSAGYFIDVNSYIDTSLIINKDTSICLGATFKINVKDTGMAFCWSASSGSVISNAISQTVTPTINTVYYFNSKTTGTNLVVNGDFENGNTGFTSEHSYKTPPRTSQSQYYIGTNPNVWFNPFVACKDHTSNGGNMMMFDGSATANTAMWKQTISIQPNTDYLFSGWVQSIVAQDPAQIILKINGNKVGATTKADLNACSWKQFSAIWNSGNNTVANLSIIDSNIVVQGNDFAIDDISFAPIVIKTDSVKVDVTNCSATPTCKGVIELHGHDKVTPPTPIKKYFAATGFTWETWFNGSYYVNENTTIDTRSKLISALDIPQCQDIVLGFGWPQVAQKNTLCFVADGPNGCTDRDNTPCTYFPVGGFQPNTWYHVAAVRDYANNTSKLYVNGALVDSKTNNHGPINPTLLPGFIFGSWTGLGSTDSGFAGKMDEIRIWDKPRTAAEIQSNYNKCLSGNETGLVAYYHANEKAGTVLHDVSLNANNATLSSTVTLNKTLSAPITNPCLLATTSSFDTTICQGLTYWNHNTSGTFVDTLVNSLGCDSLRTLNLTVKNCTASPIASFTAPDTVCVNSPVNIVNTSTGATTYNWSFCSGNANATVTETNLGNVGGNLATPAYLDYVYENGNYYGFLVNYGPSSGLVRLDFGNSLLNTPTSKKLSNVGSVFWSSCGGSGVKMIKQNGNWFGFISGGYATNGGGCTPSKLIKLEFGTNITNLAPTATDYGNIGSIDMPHHLYMWQQNSNWYGITFNAETNSITKFDFTNSFNNTPIGINIGNVGNLNFPTWFDVVNNNGQYSIFVSNTKGNSISRLDFGNSLLNTPTGINLGNFSNTLNYPRGIRIIRECNNIYGYVCNQNNADLIKLDFNNNLYDNTPTGNNIATISSFNAPGSFSNMFTVGNDKYIFVSNLLGNNLTLLKFAGCTNASIPQSSSQTPPQISYNTAGTYNINLTIDDGLATQSIVCKNVVVVAPPNLVVTQNKTVCYDSAVQLNASGASSYTWSPKIWLNDSSISNPISKPQSAIKYYVNAKNNIGCTSRDSIDIAVLPKAVRTLDTIPARCGSVLYNGNTYLTNTLVTTAIKNYLGCDSIIQQHQIIVSQSKRDTFKVAICNGQSYLGYSVSGVYKADSVRLSSGCDSISMVKLSVDKYIKDSINISICYGDKYGTHQYAGIYYDTLTSTTFCDTIRTVNLSFKTKLNPKLLDDASICEKDSIVLNPGNFYSYLWNNNAITKTITAKSVGTYWVQVADTFGCKARDTFNLISINPLPKDFLPNSLSVCDGEQYTLTGYVSYNWMTGETTPTISLTTLPLYSVKVIDINGCNGSDSMKVNYVGSLNIQSINAFSPNDDGVNETFKPFSGSCIISYSMKIFDRWGQLLFETTNPNTGWNGKYKGSILPTAVYYYIINYKNLLGIDNRKAGSITLLR